MRWLTRFAVVVMLVAGCASTTTTSAPPTADSALSSSSSTPSTSVATPTTVAARPVASTTVAPTTALPTPVLPTPVLPTTVAPAPCPEIDVAGNGVPAALQDRVQGLLANPRFDDLDVSFSASIDGYRDPIDHNADLVLLPASNQKIITAFGVAELLDLEDRFETRVEQVGSDLYLIASGDPSLTSGSLATLADEVATSVSEVQTMYVVADRYTTGTSAPGWQDWQLPTYVGPLSALMVDDNRYRKDGAFVEQPALSNAQLFADLLRDRNVAVARVAEWTPSDGPIPDPAAVIATVESPTFGRLANSMMLSSDNQNADQLVNEIGFRTGDGSIASGTVAIADALAAWCVDLIGTSGDGSGLSRENWRSAGEFRRLLAHARDEPWFSWFESSLPVAGRTGTLSSRFNSTAAEGRVQAKTGSIIGGRALSGYGTTKGGHDFVFSIIINGDPQKVAEAQSAMDEVIIGLASDEVAAAT